MAKTSVHHLVRRKGAALIALVLAGLVLVACGDDSSGATTPTPTSPMATSSPTTSAADSAERAAIDAYVGMWMAMAKAGETADWESPELAKYATGNALTTITRSLYTDQKNGVISRGKPTLDPQVTAREPDDDPRIIRISDCGDSTNWVQVDADSGEPVDDEPGGRRAIEAEVKKQGDGAWKVRRFAVQELGSC